MAGDREHPPEGSRDIDNVQLVRSMLDAVRRGDVDAMVALCHPEYEGIPLMAALEGKVYRGPDGARQWFDDIREFWEVFETHPETFHVLGDRVLAFGRWRARARVSGIELDVDTAAWLAEIRDGRLYRWRTYTDPDEAIRAVGLSSLPDPTPPPPSAP